jgi:hypothetical protein
LFASGRPARRCHTNPLKESPIRGFRLLRSGVDLRRTNSMPWHRRGQSRRMSSKPAHRTCCRAGTPRHSPLGKLRGVWRQGYQRDVGWHDEVLALGMPSGTIADQRGVCAGCHLDADFLQVLIHGFSVGARHDQSRADAAARADRTITANVGTAVVPYHPRARTDRCPDSRQRTLLPDTGLVLKPGLDPGSRSPSPRLAIFHS